MSRTLILGGVLTLLAGSGTAQYRAPSPDGLASTEIGGRYVGATPDYVDGQWIEISYGRPIKRGRDLWGSRELYGWWLRRGAPVWRAGADISTYLMTQAPLIINGTTVEPGGYTMFIDLKPDKWTLIVSGWQPQRQYEPSNHEQLWGAYGYTSAKDIVRVPMTLSVLPWSVDQLTWQFLDMSDAGGKIAIMWDKVMAMVPFGIQQEKSKRTTDPR